MKEVADLTGVSVRTLQYYDEIGVLKPTQINEAGYRLYDDAALEKLQQILFFKELDFRLKEIKEIMDNPKLSKTEIFAKQKVLLTYKRDRLNRLLALLDKLEKGESEMSFSEFDMSGYIAELEHFKNRNADVVVTHWGSIEKFDDFVQKIKANEESVAKLAIKQFGSVEKYTEAMKYNMEHFSEIMEKADRIKDNSDEVLKKTDDLYRKLTEDMSRDASSDEIQKIVKLIVEATNENNAGVNMGEGFWSMVIEGYANETIRTMNDEKYGEGASDYIVKALRTYFE